MGEAVRGSSRVPSGLGKAATTLPPVRATVNARARMWQSLVG